MAAESQTKKFGKGERTVPHHSEKAPKYYPAVEEAVPKKVWTCTQLHVARLEQEMKLLRGHVKMTEACTSNYPQSPRFSIHPFSMSESLTCHVAM